MPQKPKYSRVVLKISGEAMAGKGGYGFDQRLIAQIAGEIIELAQAGVEVGIVVGGGNIWRGREGVGMDRVTADHMGMLATVINALALQDAIEQNGMPTRVMTALEIRQIAEPYIRRRAVHHLLKGRIVIFACGTGNPYFSTDTTAALRAAEINAQAILLAKNVDGVYDSDPKANPNAKKIDRIGYKEFIAKGLAAMDTTAIAMCMENRIPVAVFALSKRGNIMRAVMGENTGTLIG
ncbi:MAG: UMP kinase [Christensenellales bacterium]|jgi:uridylate kinase|nr:UMP kinase [Clostridiales bacterium]